MRRREFITLLGGAVAAWPLVARAQPGERVRRIGVLMNLAEGDPEAQQRAKALETGLQELGWSHGRNLKIAYRWAHHDVNLRTQAAELIAAQPDLILSNTTPALMALRQETRTIPIVFVQVVDPVAQGFVPSLTHPGGNITGFSPFLHIALSLTAPTAWAGGEDRGDRLIDFVGNRGREVPHGDDAVDMRERQRALLLGFEQPRVFDRDHRLVGEGLEKGDLFVVDRSDLHSPY